MTGQGVEQAVIVDQNTMRTGMGTTKLALFNSDGTPRTVPQKAAAQADSAALTSAVISGGESPTEAEHNALRADVAALHAVVNGLLAKLRTAGVIAT